MARAAVQAGADRIFLMGYDYHYAGSDVGASAPMDRRDGADADLPWSLDLYAASDVPVEKTILGLPLYGMRWRVSGPELGAPRLGDGAIWVPADNPKFLAEPARAARDRPDRGRRVLRRRAHRQPGPRRFARDGGLAGDLRRFARDAHPQARAGRRARLAGAGFWAIGYERGLAGYRELMTSFTKGDIRLVRPIASAWPASAHSPTTATGGTRSVSSRASAAAATATSAGPVIALVQIGVTRAASRIPTTAAFVPVSARRTPTDARSRSQNGSAPKISRNDGRKMATVAMAAPGTPLGVGPATAPRNAANVNSGPGTAWAAP